MFLMTSSRGETWPSANSKAERGHKIILEVMNRHFTMGKKIPSLYVRVFSDGTAECHTEKYNKEKDVAKMKVLSVDEFERLKAAMNEPDLLNVKEKYGLMHFVVDSWMEWDIAVQHASGVQRIKVASFSPASAREKLQPYPDALVKLGCSILEIRDDVYGDARPYLQYDCPDSASFH